MKQFLFAMTFIFFLACQTSETGGDQKTNHSKNSKNENLDGKYFQSYNNGFRIAVPDGWEVIEKPKRDNAYLLGPKPQSKSDIRAKVDISHRKPNNFFNSKTEESEFREPNFKEYSSTYFAAVPRQLENYKEISNSIEKINGRNVAVLEFTFSHPKTTEIVRDRIQIYNSKYRLYLLRFACLESEYFRHEKDFDKMSAGFDVLHPNDPVL